MQLFLDQTINALNAHDVQGALIPAYRYLFTRQPIDTKIKELKDDAEKLAELLKARSKQFGERVKDLEGLDMGFHIHERKKMVKSAGTGHKRLVTYKDLVMVHVSDRKKAWPIGKDIRGWHLEYFVEKEYPQSSGFVKTTDEEEEIVE